LTRSSLITCNAPIPGRTPEGNVIRRLAPCRPPRLRYPFPFLPLAVLLGGLLAPSPSHARTALDLTDRMVIDGLTDEWESDESLLQTNDLDPGNPVREESLSDSKWGFNNDLNQIHVTWDASFLYVAVDAIIWDNNTILLFDYKAGGMTAMTELNSWRRNFVFQGLRPDLFLATWDNNTQPQVWSVQPGSENSVSEQPAGSFQTAATFADGTQGRAMEAAIPWSIVFGEASTPTFLPSLGDTVWPIPAGIDTLRVVAVLTAGGDGTGGPDSAPDNLQGHQEDSAQQVTIDNWINIVLDTDGDDIVDFDVDVRDAALQRMSFRVRPPVRGVRQEISDVRFNAPIISPEQGGRLEFSVTLSPEVPPEEDYRTVSMTAEVFNVAGDRVRTLYTAHTRPASSPVDDVMDKWDGRDDRGRMVEAGVYLLRLVLEPESQRTIRAFSVVR
ncbi:hypothetical protein K8I85_13745, partial [bacterium]|nr:hypothetical protein [bacterium]